MNKEQKATVAAVKARILSDSAFAVRVYQIIYSRQKPEEKFTGRHMGHDGKGFRDRETVYLNALYEELNKQKWRLTPEQADEVRERMAPYAGQWIKASQERSSKATDRTFTEEAKYSKSYQQARRGKSMPSRSEKLTDEDKLRIERMLGRMTG